MIHTEQTLVALHTGSVKTADAVRQSFAFDLSDEAWPSATIVAACLRIAAWQTRSSVTVSDPGAGTEYGAGIVDDAEGTNIPLTQAALRDLHEARGAFFYVDSVWRDSAGACRLLRPNNSKLALCLTTERELREAA